MKHTIAPGMGNACCSFCFIAFLLTISFNAAFGEEVGETTWTFEFTNASIPDVLDELTRVSGIDIYANQIPADKKVTKAYRDKTIEQIVKDLFKETSFALIWKDENSGSRRSLDIRVFVGGGGSPGTFSPVDRQISQPFRSVRPPITKTQDQDDAEEPEDEPVEEPEEKPEPTENEREPAAEARQKEESKEETETSETDGENTASPGSNEPE